MSGTGPSRGAYHESFARPEAAGPSNRNFGLTFAALFLVLGLLPLLFGDEVRIWALAVAGGLAAVGLVLPAALALPNRLWLRLGRALNRIIGPLILGLFYYGLLTPVAAVRRRFGKDPLRLRRAGAEATYFTDRVSAADRDSLRNQY